MLKRRASRLGQKFGKIARAKSDKGKYHDKNSYNQILCINPLTACRRTCRHFLVVDDSTSPRKNNKFNEMSVIYRNTTIQH